MAKVTKKDKLNEIFQGPICELKLNSYQNECLQYFYNQEKINNHKRFLFGLKMGLGKTFTSLTYFKTLDVRNFIIVTKSNLMWQWVKSYYQVFQNTNIDIYDKPGDEEKIIQSLLKNEKKVYVISYDRSKKLLNYILDHKLMWNIRLNMILDESQVLKHHSSQISRTYLRYSPFFNRLCFLTGSLISNKASELFVQYKILRDIRKYTYNDFVNQYFTWDSIKVAGGEIKVAGEPKKETLSELLNNLHQYSYFKDNDAILETSLNFIQVYETEPIIESKEIRKIFYNGVYEDNNFMSLINSPTLRFNRYYQILKGFLYGKKVTPEQKETLLGNIDNNFDLENLYSEIIPSNQEIILYENLPSEIIFFPEPTRIKLLNSLLENEDNYVIFYNENGEKDLIIQSLQTNGYKYLLINGEQNNTPTKVLNELKTLKLDKVCVLIQSKAGSQGIDGLQKYFNNIIWYALPFSYEVFSQANARLYRLGQENNVNIYYLQTSKWEDKIYQTLKNGQDYQEVIWSNDLSSFVNEVDL